MRAQNLYPVSRRTQSKSGAYHLVPRHQKAARRIPVPVYRAQAARQPVVLELRLVLILVLLALLVRVLRLRCRSILVPRTISRRRLLGGRRRPPGRDQGLRGLDRVARGCGGHATLGLLSAGEEPGDAAAAVHRGWWLGESCGRDQLGRWRVRGAGLGRELGWGAKCMAEVIRRGREAIGRSWGGWAMAVPCRSSGSLETDVAT
jgi:hypothetical protein